MLEKQAKRQRRHNRVRAKVKGTARVPRLCVSRSNKHIRAQLINDEKGKILVAANDSEIKRPKASKGKIILAAEVGKLIAKKANEKKIKKVVFDRGGYKYHGRVKALADGAREAGLDF